MARSLAEAGIDTTVIHDAATFAIMARVNKVLLPAHAVLVSFIVVVFVFSLARMG
jgi:translation initiation factor eIF-2B subunit beta